MIEVNIELGLHKNLCCKVFKVCEVLYMSMSSVRNRRCR